MINLSPEPLAAALSQRPAAENKHDYYNKPGPVDLGKPGPCTLHPALHTHTHTQVENRETRTKHEKRWKENSSGTAELS